MVERCFNVSPQTPSIKRNQPGRRGVFSRLSVVVLNPTAFRTHLSDGCSHFSPPGGSAVNRGGSASSLPLSPDKKPPTGMEGGAQAGTTRVGTSGERGGWAGAAPAEPKFPHRRQRRGESRTASAAPEMSRLTYSRTRPRGRFAVAVITLLVLGAGGSAPPSPGAGSDSQAQPRCDSPFWAWAERARPLLSPTLRLRRRSVTGPRLPAPARAFTARRRPHRRAPDAPRHTHTHTDTHTPCQFYKTKKRGHNLKGICGVLKLHYRRRVMRDTGATGPNYRRTGPPPAGSSLESRKSYATWTQRHAEIVI